MNHSTMKWAFLLVANVCVWGVFCFTHTTTAAPQAGKPPFSNSVAQRNEMIRELKEIKTLLKTQNSLLRDNLKAANK